MEREIYFAECCGRIKIGISTNIKARLSQLRTGSGAPVALIASVAGDLSVERALHKKLRPHRIDREWYRDCPEVRTAIQNCLNNFAPATAGEARRRTADKFREVCKILWPRHTVATVAAIAGVEERTAKRWLAGEFEPPGVVLAAVLVEITKRG